jgi:hypothetical protein
MLATAWFTLCFAGIALAAVAVVMIARMLVVGDREREAASQRAAGLLARTVHQFGALHFRPSPVYVGEPRPHRPQ